MLWSALLWDPAADPHSVRARYGRGCSCIPTGRRVGFCDPRPGGQLAWSAAVQRRRDDDAAARAALERAAPPRCEELAIAATPLPCLLRRLHPRTAVGRDRGAEPCARRVAARADLGARVACRRALAILDDAAQRRARASCAPRPRPCEALFQSIHVQLSVAALTARSSAPRRQPGGLSIRSTTALWLHARCAEIDALDTEPARLATIRTCCSAPIPAPAPLRQPRHPAEQAHLLPGAGFSEDPRSWTPRCAASPSPTREAIPYAGSPAESIGHGPLSLRYDGLDARRPTASWWCTAASVARFRPAACADGGGGYGRDRARECTAGWPSRSRDADLRFPPGNGGRLGRAPDLPRSPRRGGPGAQVSEIRLQRTDREPFEMPPERRR